MIKIKINGKEEEIKKDSNILTILEEKDMRPEMVAVELNGDLLSKDEFSKRLLSQGDTIEFLYYMAGGQLKLRIKN